jgi:hypothetical protein
MLAMKDVDVSLSKDPVGSAFDKLEGRAGAGAGAGAGAEAGV